MRLKTLKEIILLDLNLMLLNLMFLEIFLGEKAFPSFEELKNSLRKKTQKDLNFFKKFLFDDASLVLISFIFDKNPSQKVIKRFKELYLVFDKNGVKLNQSFDEVLNEVCIDVLSKVRQALDESWAELRKKSEMSFKRKWIFSVILSIVAMVLFLVGLFG